MTLKPEVMAAMERMCSSLEDYRALGPSEEHDAQCLDLIRAELLAMDARLGEAEGLLDLLRTGKKGEKFEYVIARAGQMVFVHEYLQGGAGK